MQKLLNGLLLLCATNGSYTREVQKLNFPMLQTCSVAAYKYVRTRNRVYISFSHNHQSSWETCPTETLTFGNLGRRIQHAVSESSVQLLQLRKRHLKNIVLQDAFLENRTRGELKVQVLGCAVDEGKGDRRVPPQDSSSHLRNGAKHYYAKGRHHVRALPSVSTDACLKTPQSGAVPVGSYGCHVRQEKNAQSNLKFSQHHLPSETHAYDSIDFSHLAMYPSCQHFPDPEKANSDSYFFWDYYPGGLTFSLESVLPHFASLFWHMWYTILSSPKSEIIGISDVDIPTLSARSSKVISWLAYINKTELLCKIW